MFTTSKFYSCVTQFKIASYLNYMSTPIKPSPAEIQNSISASFVANLLIWGQVHRLHVTRSNLMNGILFSNGH